MSASPLASIAGVVVVGDVVLLILVFLFFVGVGGSGGGVVLVVLLVLVLVVLFLHVRFPCCSVRCCCYCCPPASRAAMVVGAAISCKPPPRWLPRLALPVLRAAAVLGDGVGAISLHTAERCGRQGENLNRAAIVGYTSARWL